jgi:TatD DNase family protein
MPQYFDVGVNFTDPMFHGIYHGRTAHKSDIEDVVLRAKTFNVRKMLLTGSSLDESRKTLEIAAGMPEYAFTTVGCHPCSANEINKQNEEVYLDELKELALAGKRSGIVKAFGEIGLDYDRLHYTDAEHQREYFKKQLDIAVEVDLPLFLHMRAANDDFIEIIKPYLPKLPKRGVVHSFTGTAEELHNLLDLGFYIGVNGCSLRAEESLEVVKQIPLDRLLVETDAPWCEIKRTHAGYQYLTPYPNDAYPELMTRQSSSLNLKEHHVTPGFKMDPLLPFPLIKKEQYSRYDPSHEALIGEFASPLIKGRNEPVHIGQVVQMIAHLKGEKVETVAKHTYENSLKLFEVEEEQDEFFMY